MVYTLYICFIFPADTCVFVFRIFLFVFIARLLSFFFCAYVLVICLYTVYMPFVSRAKQIYCAHSLQYNSWFGSIGCILTKRLNQSSVWHAMHQNGFYVRFFLYTIYSNFWNDFGVFCIPEMKSGTSHDSPYKQDAIKSKTLKFRVHIDYSMFIMLHHWFHLDGLGGKHTTWLLNSNTWKQ